MDVLKRIKAAKTDRDRHGTWINEAIRLAMPTYRRVTGSSSPQDAMAEQDDLFDTTLQTVLEDFSSDMISTFTPRHERWVRFEPAEDLTEAQMKQVAPQLRALEDSVFAEIERSNYWDAAQECFSFWGVSTMALALTPRGPMEPLHFQPIEMPDLLIERGPDGSLTGRWRQMKLDKMGLHIMWPEHFPMPGRQEKNKVSTVYEGCDRDYSMPGEERWNYRIFVDDKEVVKTNWVGAGSCPIIVCRFRQQSDSAWGPGPAHKAVPNARTLDELAYLNLKALSRSVDPPGSYEEDGVINMEAGLSAGTWIPRASGSKAPEPMKVETRFDALVFNVDALRTNIKKALYQDRPEQPGDTPPTATQWIDERTWNTRRRELPRDRCIREWVLPIIDRVVWIKAQRGELPAIKLSDDKAVAIRPISPLSKAKDLEDMQITQQVLSLANLVGQAVQQGVPVDATATIERLKATAKERHLIMLTPEQIQNAMATAAQVGGMGDGAAAA
jgi:hypothetical protein